MTQVPPPDPAQDAPAIITSSTSALVDNASRLGLTWDLLLATVIEGEDPSNIKATCDGDTTLLSMVSMVGRLDINERVYALKVPPSGLFVIGRVFQSIFPLIQVGFSSPLAERSANTFGDISSGDVGPRVTVNIGPSGNALIVLSAEILCDNTAFSGIMSYQITKGNSVVAEPNTTSRAYYQSNVDSGGGLNTAGRAAAFCYETSLPSGENVFTAKYRARSSGGQAFFGSRLMAVLPF